MLLLCSAPRHRLAHDRRGNKQAFRRHHHLAKAPSQLPTPAEAMAPKAMKKAMTSGAIVSQVAEKTELKAKQVRAVFAELREVAYAEVAKTAPKKLLVKAAPKMLPVKAAPKMLLVKAAPKRPQWVIDTLNNAPARKNGMIKMFGKEVPWKAKPGGIFDAGPPGGRRDLPTKKNGLLPLRAKSKAFPAKSLKNDIF